MFTNLLIVLVTNIYFFIYVIYCLQNVNIHDIFLIHKSALYHVLYTSLAASVCLFFGVIFTFLFTSICFLSKWFKKIFHVICFTYYTIVPDLTIYILAAKISETIYGLMLAVIVLNITINYYYLQTAEKRINKSLIILNVVTCSKRKIFGALAQQSIPFLRSSIYSSFTLLFEEMVCYRVFKNKLETINYQIASFECDYEGHLPFIFLTTLLSALITLVCLRFVNNLLKKFIDYFSLKALRC